MAGGLVTKPACKLLFDGTWGLGQVLCLTSIFRMTSLAAARVGALEITLVFSLQPPVIGKTVVTTGSTAAIIHSRLVPSLLFLLSSDLLGILNMETLVEIVQVWRVIGLGRTNPIVLFFEVLVAGRKTMQKGSGEHVVSHVVLDHLQICLDLSQLVGVLGHCCVIIELEVVKSVEEVIAGALVGDGVSLFNEIICLPGVYTVFNLNVDAIGDPSVKQSTCQLHLFFGCLVFIMINLPSKCVVRGCCDLDLLHFIVVGRRSKGLTYLFRP